MSPYIAPRYSGFENFESMITGMIMLQHKFSRMLSFFCSSFIICYVYFIKMELFAHFIMFNAVSRSIACVSVPQSNHKYPYAIDFKMACLIVRKYYRLHNDKPPDEMFVEMLAYTVPVRAGRSDKRNLKPKSAVWFVYRVA